MAAEQIPITPELVQWARKRAGLSPADAAERFPRIYETCLRYLPENSIDDAIRELFRICRIGVVCGSIATDMTREIIDAEDLFYGVETFASMWEWGECSGDLGPGRPPAGLEDREEIKRRGGALVSGR